MKGPKVIICLPAYKAEKTLAKTVAEIPKGVADELILVDDASEDNTVKEAKRLGLNPIVHKSNKGYGRNQKTCYDEALKRGADIIVLLHPDYQYDPKTIPALIKPIKRGEADFVFGSRFAKGENPLKGGMPFYRYLGNKLTTFIENLFLGSHFSELHSGLKAYNRKFLESIPYHTYSDKFVFDSQMVIDAVLKGFRIEEVPIPTRYAPDSSSVDIYNSLKYIAETFWELIKRKYIQKK
jgi:glycosyltransferase involved in cell wall biosynthesis